MSQKPKNKIGKHIIQYTSQMQKKKKKKIFKWTLTYCQM
jgi:hypothetical protein